MSLSNIKPCIKQLKAETRKDFSRGYESKHIWKFSFQHLWPSFWSRISHPLDNVYTLDWNQLSVSYVERYLLLSFNCMSPPIPKTNQMCLFNFEWRNSILSPWRENTLNIQHTHTHTHTHTPPIQMKVWITSNRNKVFFSKETLAEIILHKTDISKGKCQYFEKRGEGNSLEIVTSRVSSNYLSLLYNNDPSNSSVVLL